jgi:hypothetical protein
MSMFLFLSLLSWREVQLLSLSRHSKMQCNIVSVWRSGKLGEMAGQAQVYTCDLFAVLLLAMINFHI